MDSEERNQNQWKILHVINVGTLMSTLDIGLYKVAPIVKTDFLIAKP